MTLKGAVQAAATAVVPEVAVPVELVAKALRRTRAPTPPTETVVVQPSENPGLYSWGKDKIRVRTRGGVRIVTVERAHRVTAGEVVLITVVGGTAVGLYALSKALAAAGSSNPLASLSSGLSSFYATGGGLPGSATISTGIINNYPNPPA